MEAFGFDQAGMERVIDAVGWVERNRNYHPRRLRRRPPVFHGTGAATYEQCVLTDGSAFAAGGDPFGTVDLIEGYTETSDPNNWYDSGVQPWIEPDVAGTVIVLADFDASWSGGVTHTPWLAQMTGEFGGLGWITVGQSSQSADSTVGNLWGIGSIAGGETIGVSITNFDVLHDLTISNAYLRVLVLL